VFPGILVLLTAPLIAIVVYVARRTRHRCRYGSPLCRSDRPCIRCYRDLFNRKTESGSADAGSADQE